MAAMKLIGGLPMNRLMGLKAIKIVVCLSAVFALAIILAGFQEIPEPLARQIIISSDDAIIIPVYNEQSTIGEVIDRVLDVDIGDIKKEIIIADDGSTDQSAQIIAKKQKSSPIIKVHTSITNLGKGAAIRCGLQYATGEIIIIQDADLELDSTEYIELLQPILMNKTKVVYGSRFLKTNKNVPYMTWAANCFLTKLTNLLYNRSLTDMETAYKVFTKEAIDQIELRSVGFDIEPELTAKFFMNGYEIVEVPISYNPRCRQEGKKISWIDGLKAVSTLFKCRFF